MEELAKGAEVHAAAFQAAWSLHGVFSHAGAPSAAPPSQTVNLPIVPLQAETQAPVAIDVDEPDTSQKPAKSLFWPFTRIYFLDSELNEMEVDDEARRGLHRTNDFRTSARRGRGPPEFQQGSSHRGFVGNQTAAAAQQPRSSSREPNSFVHPSRADRIPSGSSKPACSSRQPLGYIQPTGVNAIPLGPARAEPQSLSAARHQTRGQENRIRIRPAGLDIDVQMREIPRNSSRARQSTTSADVDEDIQTKVLHAGEVAPAKAEPHCKPTVATRALSEQSPSTANASAPAPAPEPEFAPLPTVGEFATVPQENEAEPVAVADEGLTSFTASTPTGLATETATHRETALQEVVTADYNTAGSAAPVIAEPSMHATTGPVAVLPSASAPIEPADSRLKQMAAVLHIISMRYSTSYPTLATANCRAIAWAHWRSYQEKYAVDPSIQLFDPSVAPESVRRKYSVDAVSCIADPSSRTHLQSNTCHVD